MKYRLKDQMLQLHLDIMSNGDFSSRLNATIKNFLMVHQYEKIPKSFCVQFGELMSKDDECEYRKHRITLTRDEIEKDEE